MTVLADVMRCEWSYPTREHNRDLPPPQPTAHGLFRLVHSGSTKSAQARRQGCVVIDEAELNRLIDVR
jgi:hypothetical protein